MAPVIESMVASTYVRDIDVSRGFYELLGFREHSTGRAATSAWCYLNHGNHFVLLASTRPPLAIPRLPLLFYFFFDDVDAAAAVLRRGGVEAVPMGHPPHALGGEVKLLDPDGNTVLIGQRERSAAQPPQTAEHSAHFSLLKEAAAVVAARGGTTSSCQVRTADGLDCPAGAEVKVADSAGSTAWACIAHADEILMTVPGAFVASQDPGIAGFVSQRH